MARMHCGRLIHGFERIERSKCFIGIGQYADLLAYEHAYLFVLESFTWQD